MPGERFQGAVSEEEVGRRWDYEGGAIDWKVTNGRKHLIVLLLCRTSRDLWLDFVNSKAMRLSAAASIYNTDILSELGRETSISLLFKTVIVANIELLAA